MGKNSIHNPNRNNNSNQRTQQPSAAPPSLKDIEKLLDKQSVDLKQIFDGKFENHEDRLKKLETAVFPQNASSGASTTNSSNTAATPTTASTSVPDPATTTTSNPAAAPAPAAPSTQTKQSSVSQPVMQGEMPYNGPGYAYKYWDYNTGTWCFKTNIWAAKQASNGVYVPVWVWYKEGALHHVLSNEEIAKYTP